MYSKPGLKWPLSKRPKIGFQGKLLLSAGQKYCRMLQGEHSAILSTIDLPFVLKTFVLSTFEWPLKTGFTVCILILPLVCLNWLQCYRNSETGMYVQACHGTYHFEVYLNCFKNVILQIIFNGYRSK